MGRQFMPRNTLACGGKPSALRVAVSGGGEAQRSNFVVVFFRLTFSLPQGTLRGLERPLPLEQDLPLSPGSLSIPAWARCDRDRAAKEAVHFSDDHLKQDFRVPRLLLGRRLALVVSRKNCYWLLYGLRHCASQATDASGRQRSADDTKSNRTLAILHTSCCPSAGCVVATITMLHDSSYFFARCFVAQHVAVAAGWSPS